MPIAVAKRGEGPTLLLTAGVHGDEYEGPLFLYSLMRQLERLDLAGRVIIVPSVNQPAYLAATRTSPIDQINLNRSFPGSRDGTVTQMIAHYVSSELLPLADYAIDMHAGGSSLQYLPTLFAPTWEDGEKKAAVAGLIAAFSPPRVAYFDSLKALDGQDRVFGNVADQNGCHFLTGEFGGGSTVNLAGKAMLEAGVTGVLRHLSMLPQAAPSTAPFPTRHLTISDADLFAFAPAAGIFEPAFALGDELSAGALAGFIHDPTTPWNPPVEVRFKGGGLAICIRTFASVKPGDCLGHLARDIAL
ncbi:succinylglutamate desuccinylase/aspartoacylase family protein [Bosea sp. BH3]|uniref:succinylglutamate desuccinylase/aspartoacylase family protein n=1 Tax=Bosea sp. BH3 TaxID=2871701 RepID=UPI0021CB3A64|nr:succinylglutamate desuccinylase/aspartoacylase family protein [Bosea sp. BH3]MCU4180411.1 succinylglutamate desuccinylase/aspartoacylase family protein [Bosea sp. BH3]